MTIEDPVHDSGLIAALIEEGNRLEASDEAVDLRPRAELWMAVSLKPTESELKARLAEWLRRAV